MVATPAIPIFTALPDNVTLEADATSQGYFLTVTASEKKAWHRFPLGHLAALRRFTSCYRPYLFFMEPLVGSVEHEIPAETQFLLAERTDGKYVILLPMLDGAFRSSLEGGEDDQCYLIVESADPGVVTDRVTGLYAIVGDDPYALMHHAALAAMQRMKTGRLRTDKPVPAFVDELGWCTWDAFYQDVNFTGVEKGLQSFADGGVIPKLLILDDGWLSQKRYSNSERRLTSFAANEKFPLGLGATVDMAKGKFGVQTFMVWQTIFGYWGGVDKASFPQYRIFDATLSYSPRTNRFGDAKTGDGKLVYGLVDPDDIYRFYQDFHRYLRQQGVDGVKVDFQTALELVGRGFGGRVELMKRYHEALEGSVQAQFNGNLINCMSDSNDMILQTLNSTVTRASSDFSPGDASAQGKHLCINAQTSFFMGEFVLPDWDMFQSGHPSGAYHAAARAISGGPVYVSDKIDGHNFDVLRKLVISDGSLLRTKQPALPTRDCLCVDPMRDNSLLKIFSKNAISGVIGVFHPGSTGNAISGVVRPSDIAGITGDQFIVFRNTTGAVSTCRRDAALPVTLSSYGYEIFTIVPLTNGFAAIGLADKYNSGGAVLSQQQLPDGSYQIILRDGGDLVAWCASKPKSVIVDSKDTLFNYDATTGALHMAIPTGGVCQVTVKL